MSAKGKMIELNRGVSDINMKRAYLSSIMLSVAIPVTVIAAYIGKWSAVSVRNIYIVVAVLMEIFQLVFMFVLKKQYGLDEFDRFHAIYTAYFYVTFVYLMLGAVCDVTQSGSILFYLAACVYIVFIPAFSKAECIGVLIFQTVVVIALAIVSRLDLRMFLMSVLFRLQLYCWLHISIILQYRECVSVCSLKERQIIRSMMHLRGFTTEEDLIQELMQYGHSVRETDYLWL